MNQRRIVKRIWSSAQRRPEETWWRNRLIWGDKKHVLPSLLTEFTGKVNLIYIDPPFDTGADFSFTATVPEHDGSSEDEAFAFTKEPSIIEQKAYRDTWGRGLDSYLTWFYESAVLLHELLSETGSIFVHLDWHVSHHAKAILDEVFGYENFRNEIILPGRAVKNLQQQFKSIQRLQVRHEGLLWYSKSAATRFEPYWIEKHDKGNPEGHWHHFWSTADRPTMRYKLFGVTPQSGQWVWKEERALEAFASYERYLLEGGGRTLAEYWRDTGSALEFIRPDLLKWKDEYDSWFGVFFRAGAARGRGIYQDLLLAAILPTFAKMEARKLSSSLEHNPLHNQKFEYLKAGTSSVSRLKTS
jgi:hypothetical protein